MNEVERKYITLDNSERYEIIDETNQNGIKYYFASLVDENDTPLVKSYIFEEVIEDNEKYVIPVTDEERYNALAAIFISNFNKLVDEED